MRLVGKIAEADIHISDIEDERGLEQPQKTICGIEMDKQWGLRPEILKEAGLCCKQCMQLL